MILSFEDILQGAPIPRNYLFDLGQNASFRIFQILIDF